jgi:hypothetical protein
MAEPPPPPPATPPRPGEGVPCAQRAHAAQPRTILPTPLGPRLMLVYLTGRKTGRHRHREPVSYVANGDVLSSPGGAEWRWNRQPKQTARIRIRGRDVVAQPEIVSQIDAVRRDLQPGTRGRDVGGREQGS